MLASKQLKCLLTQVAPLECKLTIIFILLWALLLQE